MLKQHIECILFQTWEDYQIQILGIIKEINHH